MPDTVLKWVIAHELGHVVQKRNWEESDGDNLEIDADKKAEEWGYVKTSEIKEYFSKRRTLLSCLVRVGWFTNLSKIVKNFLHF